MTDYENMTRGDTRGRYPFAAPDGYFDNLTARIMAQIPEEKAGAAKVVSLKGGMHKPARRWIASVAVAASVAVVAVVTGRLAGASQADMAADMAGSATACYTDDEMSSDEMMLYSMVDNGDIYAYLEGYEF